MLEKFLDCKDKSSQRPWELLSVLPPGHHIYPNGDAHVSVGMAGGGAEGDQDSRGKSRTPESGSENGEGEGKEEEASDGPKYPKSPKSPQIPSTSGDAAGHTSPDGALPLNTHPDFKEGLDAVRSGSLDVRPLSRANLNLLEEQFQGLSRANSVPSRPLTAEEKRLLQETHVLVNGELQVITQQSVQVCVCIYICV